MSSFSTCSCSSSSSIPTRDTQANPNSEPDQYKLIPSLPDDVALNCLARVPRWHHPTLSLVSKPINSLISSPHFFNARSTLNATQPFLYLSLLFLRSPRLFMVSLNPLDTTLPVPVPVPVPIPPVPSFTILRASCVLLGTDIYFIGGCGYGFVRSPHVWVLDCRLNRWRQGPTMQAPRRDATAVVLDCKIYVLDGCESGSGIWAEVLDPAVGGWEKVASPFVGGELQLQRCEAVNGKIYMEIDWEGLTYDPRSGVWELLERKEFLGWQGRKCFVGGVLYSCDYEDNMYGVDVREGSGLSNWKEVRGLSEVLPRMWSMAATLVGIGGKLFLVWCKEFVSEGNRTEFEIWCAHVEVDKNSEDGELWGTLCWSQKILSFSEGFLMEKCFALAV